MVVSSSVFRWVTLVFVSLKRKWWLPIFFSTFMINIFPIHRIVWLKTFLRYCSRICQVFYSTTRYSSETSLGYNIRIIFTNLITSGPTKRVLRGLQAKRGWRVKSHARHLCNRYVFIYRFLSYMYIAYSTVYGSVADFFNGIPKTVNV